MESAMALLQQIYVVHTLDEKLHLDHENRCC